MVNLTARDREQLRNQLQDAVVKCSERCLYQSAKWLAELLNSLPSPPSGTPDSEKSEEDSQMTELNQSPTDAFTNVLTANNDEEEGRLEMREVSKYLLAKSYFDCREYDRCAAVFLPDNFPRGPVPATFPVASQSHSTKPNRGKSKASPGSANGTASGKSKPQYRGLSQKALFMALYAKFMAGEKRKDEDSEMILGPLDGGITVNKEVVSIGRALEARLLHHSKSDGGSERSQGWLEYLYGVILAKEKNDDEARRWLIRSVTLFPYNWSAWLELGSLISSVEELNQVSALLPNHLMTFIFNLYSSQELYQADEATHSRLTDLERVFPGSQFLKTQRALLFHHSKDFEEAESIFSSLLHTDPHRIDSLDHYSNILYVMSDRPKLAFLAQVASATDKFRPETCCVVGNYYSLKSEHEKAVMYFRRALTLDRSFLSAWTLMGHEYVEMKNTHAAIESYRRAVDVNRKDYRAWYGLGQTYEVLEMHYYALFYYQRAASLRPYDPKMWQAVGSCFTKMDRPLEAIKALKRALIAGSYYDHASSSSSFGSHPSSGGIMDPETLYQIALMYDKLDDSDEAATYMELTLAQEEGTGAGGGDDDNEDDDNDNDGDGAGVGTHNGVGVTATTSKARMWLAKWELQQGGLARAIELANELCQDGVEVEEAKALVRDLRARMEATTGQGVNT
ncbi:MAG: Anaphase-promoting complex subunit 23 [Sclerophora amabilis]|nr:MAG: Anaphase-promoting complex subunit 23 [Sclerophora amabilis]